jgi:hypothetical protein
MAIDITVILIQRITSQLPADDASNQQDKIDLFSRLNGGIGNAANYLAVGSAVETLPATFYAVVERAALPNATAETIAAAAAGATATVVGATVAIVILVISLIVGLISALSQPDSGDIQLLNNIYQGMLP